MPLLKWRTIRLRHLGVVRLDDLHSFVMADIPGLISGASEGAGLGIRFLKHLSRMNLLLHVLDILPADQSDPVENFHTIENELSEYDLSLKEKTRWLVLNKVDLVAQSDANAFCDSIVKRLKWQGPVFLISALRRQGTFALCQQIMLFLEKQKSL